ncbi:uncharacterized protein KY384_002565 [Bacidia gigantensis]|uniref:uncharacterized protein n=1 Tax=Bacidia gigantensis TaxID=2732470 RepID=UPI001D059E81|nr:uncharacterized protein KY384_002565 [Bacidia gigantensis]KAG8532688.1 hypothetical protein KY384_002565 [Bacidia gigantensis]
MGSRLEAKSTEVRRRIEKHRFEDEQGEEYEPSKFGGFNDYFRRKKIKLQNLDAELRSSARDKPSIFKGVVAHVNGYTQPSLNDLHTLIVSHGGGFIQYLDGKTMVTHIIASNLTPKKKVEFAKYRIVKPAWVVDSVKAGKLLSWNGYRVVDEGVGQRVLGFEHGSVVSQANKKVEGYRNQTDTSWYTSQVKDIANQVSSNDQGVALETTLPSLTERLAEDGNTSNDSNPSSLTEHINAEVNEALNTNLPESPRNSRFEPDFGEQANEKYLKNDSDDQIRDAAPLQAIKYSSTEFLDVSHDLIEDNVKDQGPATVPKDPADEVKAKSPSFWNDESLPESPQSTGLLSEPSSDVLRSTSLKPEDGANQESSGVHTVDKVSKRLEDLTAEEHNALLLADPKVWKSTVVNPGFLKQYYEESRLHHLSTWKATLKSELQALASEKTASQKAKDQRKPGTRRYILHVDFDSFFAAVSLRKFPHLTGEPVVVAHGNGSGAEIASCNYPARKFGIKNGMWMKHAQKMCPELKVLPYDFKAYEDASRKFYEAIISTDGMVQSISVDEALLDMSVQCIAAAGHDGRCIHEGSIWREQAAADSIAQGLRDEITEKTGCAVSIGIGGNILLAKVALRKAKPAGQYQIKPEDILDFLGDLTMQDLPGIAYSIGGRLEEIGVKYVKDVRQLSKERMISVLGPKTGEKVWDYSRGIDRAEVGDQVIRKSVSAEVNWGIRFVTQEQVDEFIYCLAEELQKRLQNEGVKGRQLTMKIMRRAADAPLDPPKHLGHGKCDTFNKSLALGVPTNDYSVIGREALSILKGHGFTPGELRGLGIQMQRLEPIHTNAGSGIDSSQKRLQFKTLTPRKPAFADDSLNADEIESPQKAKGSAAPHTAAAFPKVSSSSSKPRLPLNTLGTQFVLPSRIDPEILKELPDDIRSKLLQSKKASSSKARTIETQGDASPEPQQEMTRQKHEDSGMPRPCSSTPALATDSVPTHSQIDKETLDALPADVRSEVLAYYAMSPSKTRNQSVLPQSPRKDRAIKLPKKLTTPIKKRGRPLGGGGLKAQAASSSTLTQSNFVANQPLNEFKAAAASIAHGVVPDEISADFLAELPDELRHEVLAQARRDRLQKNAGLDLAARKKRPPLPKGLPAGQRTLSLPPRPPKPTFTAKKFTGLADLRNAVMAWYEEFKEEPPYEEDVASLSKYLRRVIIDEGDMEKAVNLLRWLRWVIDEDTRRDSSSWRVALKHVENEVQDAIEARGLGKIDLS